MGAIARLLEQVLGSGYVWVMILIFLGLIMFKHKYKDRPDVYQRIGEIKNIIIAGVIGVGIAILLYVQFIE
jgi:Na+-transporting NADH:ubiquinone oxidoreductase subunit NqrE